MEYNQVFDALTETEFAVLYWKCQGLTHDDIGARWGYSRSWVQKQSTSAELKLGLSDLLASKRAVILENEICPALTKWIENHPDKLKRLPPPSAIEITPLPPPPRPPRWRAFLVLGIILLIVGYLAFQLGRSSVASKPTYPVIAITAVTQVITQVLPQAPIPSIVPSSLPTIVPTDTSIPATETPVPTVFVAPTDGILFQDNFDNGLKPDWQTISGTWLVTNGRLSILGEGGGSLKWISVPLPWNNYAVSVNVSYPENTSYPPVAIAVRKNVGSKIGVDADNSRNSYFAIFTGGNVMPVAGNPGVQLPLKSDIEVDVQNNNYMFKVNGESVQNISISGYDTAGIELGLLCINSCPSFDNVKVTYLP